MRRLALSITFLLLLPALPGALAAQTPVAPPVSDAGGWRIADMREIDVDARYAALSPDGRALAGVGPGRTICVWDISTLAPSCAGERLPIREETITWAPDGTAVAFALDAIRQLYESDIYIYEVASGELVNVTDDGIGGDVLGTLDQHPPIDDTPTWSPDSQQIAFARSYSGDEEPGTTSIMRIDRSGGEPVEVLELDVEQPFTVWLPMHWLPDGTLLYSQLSNELDDQRNGVWKVGVDDGSSPLQVVPGNDGSDVPGPMVADVDAASGRAIVYSYLLMGQRGVDAGQPLFWLVEPATSERIPFPVPPGEAPVIEAGFSPDGTAVVLATGVAVDATLALMDPATGAVTELEHEALDVPIETGAVQWAENDTVLLQRPSGPLLVTLERVS